jgi:hypothetical protein
MAERERLKMLQILRKMPGQLAVDADYAIGRQGGKEIDPGSVAVYAAWSF